MNDDLLDDENRDSTPVVNINDYDASVSSSYDSTDFVGAKAKP